MFRVHRAGDRVHRGRGYAEGPTRLLVELGGGGIPLVFMLEGEKKHSIRLSLFSFLFFILSRFKTFNILFQKELVDYFNAEIYIIHGSGSCSFQFCSLKC